MFDAKLHWGHTRPEVELVECVIVVALFEERSIGRLGEIGLVVKQVKHADRFLGNQIDHWLVVLNKYNNKEGETKKFKNRRDQFQLNSRSQFEKTYDKSDGLPFDALLGVLLLLQFENVLIKVELKVLVGVVDAQLFQTVFLFVVIS